MAEQSKIEWTDHTFNPWIGCEKISPACRNCYAAVDSPARVSRAIGLELWGGASTGAKRRVTSESTWAMPFRWNKRPEKQKVFCASQCDIFEDFKGQLVDHHGKPLYAELLNWWRGISSDHVSHLTPLTLDRVRTRLFAMIYQTSNLDWLLLTKRPENIAEMIPDRWKRYPPMNLWLGVTAENQEYFDQRVPVLIRQAANVRFLSVEPMSGPIDLGKISSLDIHWIIAGGESGQNAIPSNPEWYQSLRDQCHERGIKFFFKQWGEWIPHSQLRGQRVELEDYERLEIGKHSVHRLGKKMAGRLLDGREWNEFPA